MPKEVEEPKVNEQNESLADGKKIDLYINNPSNEEQGISIMNVFSRLKQRFHIYIFVILIGLLAGLLVPTLMYTFKDKDNKAVAIIGLDYAGAEAGQAPDGGKLDISYVKSSYIIQNALSNVTLSKEVTTAQVQANLTITGILTEETKQQMEIINKLEEAKNNEFAKLLQSFSLQYRTQYIVSLNSVFRDGNNKITLSSSDTSRLLSAIANAYNDYFVETYQEKSLPSNYIDAINVNKLDYLDILDEISTSYDYLEDYCNSRASFLPGFRASNGKSFADLVEIIETVKQTEIDDYYSFIYLNNVSKDKTMQLTNYRIQKRDAEYSLVEIDTKIATLQASINNYKPDKVKINNVEGTGTIEVDVYPEGYYQLILDLKALNESKSNLQRRLAILNDRITKLEGPEASEEQKAGAAVYVSKALDNAKNIYALVREVSAELFESNAYKSRYMHTITTYESEKLSSQLKLFAIGAAVGLGLGLIIWVMDAFVLEFKAVKKANDLKEAK